jgi:hypothetical protein
MDTKKDTNIFLVRKVRPAPLKKPFLGGVRLEGWRDGHGLKAGDTVWGWRLEKRSKALEVYSPAGLGLE